MSVSAPKYRLIADDIMTGIEKGHYVAGEQIPSENELAQTFGVSVPTARRALLELVYSNKIVRVKGKGSFVKEPGGDLDINNPGELGKSIGFLLPPHNYDDSLLKILRGVQRPLHDAGYSINVLCSDDTTRSEVDMIQRCFSDNIAGLILFSVSPDYHRETLRRLEAKGVPVILLDRGYTNYPCNLVSSYNKAGAYNITSYLIRGGHKRIAFISSNPELATVVERIAGYKLALLDHGIEYDDNLVVREYADDSNCIVSIMQKYRPSVMQCVNDNTAIAVMQMLQTAGYKIPEDVSVTGFDGVDVSRFFMKKLTTAVQQFEKMGEMAAELVVEQIGKRVGYSQLFLPTILEVNETTREI